MMLQVYSRQKNIQIYRRKYKIFKSETEARRKIFLHFDYITNHQKI